MNSQTPVWVTILVAVVAVVGQVITTTALLLNGRWQRDQDKTLRDKELAQDLELRRRDHEHELAVREIEDRRQRRDRRVAELRAGLMEMVEAFIGLAELQQELFLYRDSRPEEIEQATTAAKEHFERARPGLALDPAGQEIARSFRAAQTEISQFRTLLNGQQTLLEAHADSAITHGDRVVEQNGKITDMLNEGVERLQQIMEETAKSVP